MKQKYPWFIAVSALLVAGALSSCESDASFGSQEVEVVPGPSNPEGNPDDSYSSSQTSGSSSSTGLVSCDLGGGECYSGITASVCDTNGGDVVSSCPVDGSSSSTSDSVIGCVVEYAGQSQCTEMTEAQCQEVISQAAGMGVSVTMQNNCD